MDQLLKRFPFASEKLIHQTREAFATLTAVDVEYMCVDAKRESKWAQQFRAFVETHEAEAIIANKGKPHFFWSCFEARIKAQHELLQRDGAMDHSYPFISFLFALCTVLRNEVDGGVYTSQMTMVSYAISRVYASLARGTALVFLSTDKPTEPTGITLGNNFWEAELPVLQANKAHGIIHDILALVNTRPTIASLLVSEEAKISTRSGNLSCLLSCKVSNLCNNEEGRRRTSSSSSSSSSTTTHQVQKASHTMNTMAWQVKPLEKWARLPLWRRDWHELDGPECRCSFVRQRMEPVDWAKWRTSPPRTFITMGSLIHVAQRWRRNTAKLKRMRVDP